MKNYSIKPGSAFVFSKNKYGAIFLFFATIFMISCRKDINENFNGATITDSTAVSASAIGNTYYLSPTGNDNNPGSLSAPFFTLNKAWSVVAPGDIIYMRGGTYVWTTQSYLTGKNGTPGNLIKIWNYPGEIPVLSRHSINYTILNPTPRSGCYLSGDYIHIKGLEITGYFQSDGWVSSGWWANNCNNSIFESLNIHHNGGGFYLQGNSTGNLLLNIDSWSNYDAYTGGGNADGINIAYISNASSTNTVKGCRAWYNSDDGFDFSQNPGFVAVENSWSYKNGYLADGVTLSGGNSEGFKSGPPGDGAGGMPSHAGEYLRSYTNCIAAKNWSHGFSTNNSVCTMHFNNNTAYLNGFGFFINYGNEPDIYRNNLSYANRTFQVTINAAAISDHNAATGTEINNWNSATISDADFISTDATQLISPRKSDGNLPEISFLKLSAGSSLINAGINVGLPFSGSAPDIGAFEYGGTSPLSNQAPIANAGVDKSITLPANSISITGSGSDPDGTISSYTWSLSSGPNTPVLTGINTTTLVVNNLIAGTYIFRITVTDNNGLSAFDEVNVVLSNAVIPPSTNLINVSQIISYTGYAYYVVQDFGTLPDIVENTTRSVLRVFENGIELKPPHSMHGDIATLGRGRFSHWGDGAFVALYFSASDNTNPKTNGRSYTFTISSAAANQAPVANASTDKTITLPVSSVSITGSGSDPDGTIASYTWTFRSGPNTPVLSGTNTTTLSASNLVAGTYVFRLTVTDNGGLTALDEVNVVVAAAPPPSTNLINVSKASKDGGFSYYVVQNFGTLADDNSNPTKSVLRIFENGIELKPAHSLHSDIRTIGKGRFSHWSDGSIIGLYFSASNNTNPKTNGKTYTYTIQ